jgi:integrase
MAKSVKTQENKTEKIKKTRRSKGEGSFGKTRRADGYLLGQVTIGHDPFTGKPIRKSVYGKTKAELTEKMTALKYQVQQGIFDVVAKDTLDEFFEQWIASPHSFEPLTITSYRTYYKSSFKDTLGSKKLKNITTLDIQRVISARLEGTNCRKLKPEVVRNHWIFLNRLFDDAKELGKIIKNPCSPMLDDMKQLKKKAAKKEKVILDREEIPVFLEAIKENKYFVAHMVELYTGARRSELLGLSWKSVDLEKNTITICQQLTPEKTIKTQLKHNGEPRTIEIPEEITALLRTHKAQQNERRLLLGKEYDKQGFNLVFAFEDGSPINSRSFYTSYKLTLKKAGLNYEEMTYHSLRHLLITLLLENGVKLKTVQEIAGHKNAQTTLDVYAHVTKGQTTIAAETLKNIYSGNNAHELNSSINLQKAQ